MFSCSAMIRAHLRAGITWKCGDHSASTDFFMGSREAFKSMSPHGIGSTVLTSLDLPAALGE